MSQENQESQIQPSPIADTSPNNFNRRGTVGLLRDFWNDERGDMQIGTSQRASAFFEPGVWGKKFLAVTALGGASLAWYINTVTSAQGLADSQTPADLNYAIGFGFNAIEMVGLQAVKSRVGLHEFVTLAHTFGYQDEDNIEKIVTGAMLGIVAGVYVFDAYSTGKGLEPYIANLAVRWGYAVTQTLYTEMGLGAWESLWRGARKEDRTRRESDNNE